MTDAKLSALLELAAAPATNDELYIRDVSDPALDQSKRITVANLISIVNIKPTEQTFGASLVHYGQWTITDADVKAASNIIVRLSTEVPSALRDGVAADGDEAEMEPMDVFAENIALGSFLLVAIPRDGPVDGPYVFNYLAA